MSELNQARWYVIHTYSGHENKVKATIEKAVKTRGMEQYIQKLLIPTEKTQEEDAKGKVNSKERKIFPAYVLVKMVITDESWYVVRNTKGVTGFVGPGSKPVPLTEEEVKFITNISLDILDLEVGELVEVKTGVFAGQTGKVEEIDIENRELKVGIDVLGRTTLCEIDIDGVKKI